MIICPLNNGECNRLILPKPRTAFLMAPSIKHKKDAKNEWSHNIVKGLSALNYDVMEGSNIVRHGDYFCSICQATQGCALGIAVVYDGLPVSTISNIYLEAGIMLGFGKPVALFVDKKRNLPTDYIRHYVIFYNARGYLSKYKSLLEDIVKLAEDFYEPLGQVAFNAGDYEKAAKYYQEAYLIGPKQQTLDKLKSIASELKKTEGIPDAYKKRLVENIEYFCSKTK